MKRRHFRSRRGNSLQMDVCDKKIASDCECDGLVSQQGWRHCGPLYYWWPGICSDQWAGHLHQPRRCWDDCSLVAHYLLLTRCNEHPVAPYCAIPQDYLSDTPLLRAMGFLVSQHGQLGAIPPPPFSERVPLAEHAKWRCDTPPPSKGVSQRYLRDTL